MTTDVFIDRINVTVRARLAATAWMNAFLATGESESNAALYQTLSIEWFDTGMQFIGCNGSALFRAWVPAVPNDEDELTPDELAALEQWPTDDDPIRQIIVQDPDGFGLAFMRALLAVTNGDGHEYEPLLITTSPMDDEATLALGAEFATERLTLRACGQRIDLKLLETRYPNWRQARLGIEDAERVDGLRVSTDMFKLVGRLKGVSSVDLSFFGEKRHIVFEAMYSEPKMRGLIMPMQRVKPTPEKKTRSTATAEQSDWTTEAPPHVSEDGLQEIKAAKERESRIDAVEDGDVTLSSRGRGPITITNEEFKRAARGDDPATLAKVGDALGFGRKP